MVDRETEDEMEVTLDSLTIASMLSWYLKKDERVSFAAFRQVHPLSDEVKLVFKVKEGNPRDVLKETIRKALSDISELREALLGSLS